MQQYSADLSQRILHAVLFMAATSVPLYLLGSPPLWLMQIGHVVHATPEARMCSSSCWHWALRGRLLG
jgi:hypothetical protein